MTRIEQKTKKNRLIKFNRDVQEKNRFLYEMLGQPAPEQYIFLSPRTGNLTRWNTSTGCSRYSR